MTSWVTRQGGVPTGPRLCFRCNQSGHFIAQCPYEYQAQENADIARPLPLLSAYYGGCTSICDGRGGYTTGRAPVAISPAGIQTSFSPEPEGDTYSVATFDTHLLIAKFAHRIIITVYALGFGGGQVWMWVPAQLAM